MAGKTNKNLIKSIKFAVSKAFSWDRTLVFLSFVTLPFFVLNRLADIYLVSFAVDFVERGDEAKLIISVLCFGIYSLVSVIIMKLAEKHISTRSYMLKNKFITDYADKYMTADYSVIESVEGKDMAQRGKNAMIFRGAVTKVKFCYGSFIYYHFVYFRFIKPIYKYFD